MAFRFMLDPVFLYTNHVSAWIANTDLTPTTPEECKEAIDKPKAKALAEAYKVAAEGHDLEYFKGLLKDHEEALQEDRAEKAEKENKKAGKGKRKSDAVAQAADPDDMEVDDEEAGDEKPKSKKRKKSLDTDGPEKVRGDLSLHDLKSLTDT